MGFSLGDPLGLTSGGLHANLTTLGDPLNINGKDTNNILFPNSPGLSDPQVNPTYVTNPFLDGLGLARSARIGRNALRVDLGSYTAPAVSAAPSTPNLDPSRFLSKLGLGPGDGRRNSTPGFRVGLPRPFGSTPVTP